MTQMWYVNLTKADGDLLAIVLSKKGRTSLPNLAGSAYLL
jgi:hypothetical protein